MRILGIGGSVHDFAACLLTDGQIEVAVEEERLSRIKHHPLYALGRDDRHLRSIDYCLEHAAIELGDVDLIVTNDLIFRPMIADLPAVQTINHHLAHASCCYYTSDHDRAAVLVVDGFGSISGARAETVSYFLGEGAKLDRIWRGTGNVVLRGTQERFSWRHFDFVEGSFGGFYSFVSGAIGFGSMEEGKMMGLAPYGTDRWSHHIAEVCSLDIEGNLGFGQRERDHLAVLIERELAACTSPEELFSRRADIAWAAQSALERWLLWHADRLAERTGASSLCLTGGVFLNCLANYRIATETNFERVHVHGAAGDSGTAIGAALWAHAATGGDRVPPPDRSIFSGRSYSATEIAAAIGCQSDLASSVEHDIVQTTAGLLADGAVVGWFQGGAEFGPRALGNRSILADPRRAEMKDLINEKVKRRETFRPFAPAVLAAAQRDFYAFDGASPFMTFAPPTVSGQHHRLAAATHVDGTGRIETVTEEFNPRLHHLLRSFGALTDVPVLLNTSFNEQEPIVETPAQAIDCFRRTAMDCLVLGDHLVWKREHDQTRTTVSGRRTNTSESAVAR